MGSQSLEMSQYAQVLFVNVLKSYPAGADVEVKYTVTAQLRPSAADWLGVFKIGWTAAIADALQRVPVNLPEKYEPGQSTANCVAVFEGSSLPKDADEFYQFCYINGHGQVRGASTPFQFKQSNTSEDEFVEEDLEDMLIVTSKRSILDEKLDVANEKIKVLNEEKLELVKDRQHLMLELSQVKKKLEETREWTEQLDSTLQFHQSLGIEQTRATSEARKEYEKLKTERDTLAAKVSALEESELKSQAATESLRAMLAEVRADAARRVEEVATSSLVASSAEMAAVREECRVELARLKAQLKRAQDDLLDERRRFVELEQSLASHQAEAAELLRQQEQLLLRQQEQQLGQQEQQLRQQEQQLRQQEQQLGQQEQQLRQQDQQLQQQEQLLQQQEHQLREQEQQLRSQFDEAINSSRSEVADLTAQLKMLQSDCQRLRQALTDSECKIKELISHNACLVEETGREQGEAMEAARALNEELAALKARLAEVEKERLSGSLSQQQTSGSGLNMDSYHALHSAYCDLKAMLKERTRERDALAGREKAVRSANGNLLRENRSLSAQLTAAEQELRSLRPADGGRTAGAPVSAASADPCVATGQEVQRLREQIAASDEYYMSTLQQLQKDLRHEREARRSAEQLLQRVSARIGGGAAAAAALIVGAGTTSEVPDVAVLPALDRKVREAGSDQEIPTTSSTDPMEKARMECRGAVAAAAAASVSSSSSSSSSLGRSPSHRLQRCPSDDDGQLVREPPDDPFLLTNPQTPPIARHPSAAPEPRSMLPPPLTPIAAPPPPRALATAYTGTTTTNGGALSPVASPGLGSGSRVASAGLVSGNSSSSPLPRTWGESRVSTTHLNDLSPPSRGSHGMQAATRFCPVCSEPLHHTFDEATRHVNEHFA